MLKQRQIATLKRRLDKAKASRQRMAAFMCHVQDHASDLKGTDMAALTEALGLPRSYAIDGHKALAMTNYRRQQAAS